MTWTRVRAGVAALALVAVAGCGLGTDPGQHVPTVAVPEHIPATFADSGRWEYTLATDTAPVGADEGVAVLVPGRTSQDLMRVALLDPADGSTRWISDDFEVPYPAVVPTVDVAQVGGAAWIVVTARTSDDVVRVDAYAPAGGGDRRTPDYSVDLTGVDGTPPDVEVSSEGITAHGVSIDGGGRVVSVNPSGQRLDPYDGPGDMVTAWSEGTVANRTVDGAGFGFVVDGEMAWQSQKVRPAGTDRNDPGTLLAAGAGVVVAQWTAANGTPLLAVHEIRSGRVLAQLDQVQLDGIDASRDSALVQSTDGQWVVWGPYVFGVQGGPSQEINIGGGQVTTVHQNVAYVSGSNMPLTVSDADSAGGGNAMATSDGGYVGMVDVLTGSPLTNTVFQAVPVFVSTASQGVFAVSDNGRTRAISVPMA